VQDTGFSQVIPTGHGLLCFSNLDEAAEAITAVEAEYESHCRAARELALTHFDYRVVLEDLLRKVGLGTERISAMPETVAPIQGGPEHRCR